MGVVVGIGAVVSGLEAWRRWRVESGWIGSPDVGVLGGGIGSVGIEGPGWGEGVVRRESQSDSS